MQALSNLFGKLLSTKNAEHVSEIPIVCKNVVSTESEAKGESTKTQICDMDNDLILIRETVYDLIKDIVDPEKPQSLEELHVVAEHNVQVQRFNDDQLLIKITFVPTVPHCSLASLIGLCIRHKLTTCLPEKHKLDIFIQEGTHETAAEINKQINDKERIAAAMENPNLRELVNRCLNEQENG